MKKLSFWMKALIPVAVSAAMFVSCDKNGNNPEDPDPGKDPSTITKPSDLNNQALGNGSVFDLQSVVYTTEEIAGSTVFYASPTAGITDIEGMIEADDYIRFVAADTSGQNTQFEESDNALSYGEMVIDAENCGDYDISSLFVYLETPTVVEFTIDAASKNGSQKLMANYYGYCTRWPAGSIEDEAGDRICVEIAQAVYFGQGSGTNAHEYDLLVSTSPLTQATDGTLVLLEKEGYAMHIAFFAIPNSAYRTRLPQGTYKNSDGAEAGTYLSVSYLAQFETENGSQTMTTKPFDGDITVSTDNEGVTTIRAYFIDESGRRRLIAFQGKLGSFLDANSATYLPQLNEDVAFEGNQANGIYYGRMGEEAYGAFEIVIYEDAYLNGEEETFGATLLLTSKSLFTSEAELKSGITKLNGTYTASSSLSAPNTWFKPVEMNVYGMIQPYGTFVHKYDGSYYGQFGYAADGEVKVEFSEDGTLHLEFDLLSVNGSKMVGSYDGTVDWDWAPVVSSGDDGTSTLTEDYDMDLSRFNTARLVVPQQIYIGGIGYTNMSDYTTKWGSKSVSKNDDIGYQYIALANISENSDNATGDHLFIELVTAPGEDRQLKPGHYTVSKERWPAHFHPMNSEGEGVAIKGMLLNSISYTSHWEHHKWTGGLSVMDGHAYFYGGEVWITENDDDTWTFKFDCLCVREHHVRGEWTGPVSGIETPTDTAEWHAPLLPEAKTGWLNSPIVGEIGSQLEKAAAEKAQNSVPLKARL